MTDQCIHGFETQTCASCRRCVHGILESRCGTCAPRTAREATLQLANEAARPSESHRGYEISYVPGERSWYIRADTDEMRSRASFRSAFQARRAIDAILDAPPPSPNGKKARKA
jgi:hypothetical protein